MSVPVHTLNKDQKKWYAKIVIAAILADDEISPSEIDFLKQVIAIVNHPDDKKELMQMISSKKGPEIEEPPGIQKEILAAIFIELLLIMISDLDFADKEKKFLKKISAMFELDGSYFAELMRWGEAGLAWKLSQQTLIGGDKEADSLQVPINQLVAQQKKWYSSTLISTIMLDGSVDESEISFLKAAVSFVESKKDQMELLGYVRNKMAPKLLHPPEFPENILVRIFIEVIRIVAADENMSYAEHSHLKALSDKCGFSTDLFNELLEWCNQGIKWMQDKNPLITNVKLKPKSAIPKSMVAGVAENPENSSILNREFECFACGSETKVKAFQLKPHTQEPQRNIFGITTFEESAREHDFIDYNLIKIIICPSCFFASQSKELFRRNTNEEAPKLLTNPEFKKNWFNEVDARKAMFGDKMGEISTIKRSASTVVKSYQLAISVAEMLGTANNDNNQMWQAVTLTLTLAEILMNYGKVKSAEEYLSKAQEKAEFLFKNSAEYVVTFRAARVLFYIGLYLNDVQTAGPYVEFLKDTQMHKLEELEPNEMTILKKVFGETRKALSDRAEYKKENLIGFHKNM
mgnify:CR=1 FL=1